MNTREMNFWSGSGRPRIAPEHFNEIVATAADIALVINLDGQIETVVVNPLNQTMGRLDHWINRDLSEFLAEDSRDRVEALLKEFRSGASVITKSVEINHFDNANWEFPIRYTFHLTGEDGAILMLGRDLRPIAELQQRLVKAQLALEVDYESRRDFETRYRVLMENSRDALVLVDAASGRITDLNKAAAAILGSSPDALVGGLLSGELSAGNKSEFLDRLIAAAANDGATSLQSATQKSRRSVAIFPTLFRAGGDRTLLCRLETENRAEGVAAELAANLSALYRDGADAMVFTDEKGILRSANEAFMALCDAAQMTDIKGRSLADFLLRSHVDLKVLLENAQRSGKMRLYATRLSGHHGSQLPVEVSATHLSDQSNASFAFVFRDASRSEMVREGPTRATGQDMKNVVELVGSSPLKDIVSATTDVIEKICIETAVELTGNNRVAAAEMLGLSRQSLYVKLRKYDLLDKTPKD
ncbi:transcriptional regulator PpsR [Litoreibacter ponti]|uniref:Transcriptional regulator PpsR n=1 Tax=Litoreibacter ponti TaxID=1510457 RepID=A0A2T6BPG6_9RHOB|nr:transcriptional regulator PpsR [Litoreibacter ponti]PTX57973.1 transcriptional regulator PpsR [Litoreibacter ponti]